MSVWGCAEMTGGSAVRKYEERWRRWEQQHAFLNCIEMAASPIEAECHWCHFSNGLSSWYGFQNVRQSSSSVFADIWGCSGHDLCAPPYIAYCKIVEFIGLNGMVGGASQAAAGTLLSLCWGTWPWSCASTNPQHTLLGCFPGAALCWVAALRAGFANPVPTVSRCGSAHVCCLG